jgi:hypothetical protein
LFLPLGETKQFQAAIFSHSNVHRRRHLALAAPPALEHGATFQDGMIDKTTHVAHLYA